MPISHHGVRRTATRATPLALTLLPLILSLASSACASAKPAHGETPRADPDDLAQGLRVLYYSETATRVDAYLRTVARVDGYLKAVAWADASARARADEAGRQALAARAAPPANAPRSVAARPAPVNDAEFAAQVLQIVNGERTRAGLAPLSSDDSLTRAASGYARTMAQTGNFAHVGLDGSTFDQRIVAAGFPPNRAMSEVIVWGTGLTPAGAVASWMGSAVHRPLVLSSAYAFAGVGCASAGGAIYCVMDLGG